MADAIGSFGGYPIFAPDSVLEQCIENELDASGFTGKANSFCCGLGATPGRGFLLMEASDVANLSENSFNELILGIDDVGTTSTSSSTTAPPGPNGGVAQTFRWQKMPRIVFIRAINLFATASDEETRMVLVEISDVRFWLKKSFINFRYNMRCLSGSNIAYWPSTLRQIEATTTTEPPDPEVTTTTICGRNRQCTLWTWRTMLDDIWWHLPPAVAGAPPALPDDFSDSSTTPYPIRVERDWHTNPDRMAFTVQSALDAYVEALARFGAVLSYDPIRDAFEVWINGDVDFETEGYMGIYAADHQLRNDYPSENSKALIPERVVVCFQSIYADKTNESFYVYDYFPVNYAFDDFVTDYGLDDSVYEVVAGTAEIIIADYNAIYGATVNSVCTSPSTTVQPQSANVGYANPVNMTSLVSHAKAMARRYYMGVTSRIVEESTERIFEGILPLRTSGRADRVCWYDVGSGWMTKIEKTTFLENRFRKEKLPVVDRDGCCCPDISTSTSLCPTTTTTEAPITPCNSGCITAGTRQILTVPSFETPALSFSVDGFTVPFSGGTVACPGLNSYNAFFTLETDDFYISGTFIILTCGIGAPPIYGGFPWGGTISITVIERETGLIDYATAMYGASSAGGSYSVIPSPGMLGIPESVLVTCDSCPSGTSTTTTTTIGPCDGFTVWRTVAIEGVGFAWEVVPDGGPGCSGACTGDDTCFSLPPTEDPASFPQGTVMITGCSCGTAATISTTTLCPGGTGHHIWECQGGEWVYQGGGGTCPAPNPEDYDPIPCGELTIIAYSCGSCEWSNP